MRSMDDLFATLVEDTIVLIGFAVIVVIMILVYPISLGLYGYRRLSMKWQDRT